jgi:Flp pilus assembly protein TadB
MLDSGDDDKQKQTLELRIGMHKALFGVTLTIVASGMLLFVAVAHRFLPLRVAAAGGVAFSFVCVAYWLWWCRYYYRALRNLSKSPGIGP